MNNVLPQVIGAVRAAADMLLAEASRPGGPRGGGSKADVDVEMEHLLREALAPLGDAGFAGEETGTTPAPPGVDFLWLVDPHDGTSEFLRGWRGSSISVCLLRRGVPVLGVVCAPLSPDRGFDLIAWADGGPLTRNGEVVQGHLRDRALDPGGYVYLNPRAARMAQLNSTLVAPARFIGMPSIAYRLARVAAGDGVATMSLHGLHAWDVGGGHALLRAAGGTLLDEMGRPVRYDPNTGSISLRRCFGGAPAAAAALVGREWDRLESASAAPPRLQLKWPRPLDPARLDRGYGALLGLGAAAARARNGAVAGAGELCTGEMRATLALGRSLVRCGGYDAEDAARACAAWRTDMASDDGHPADAAAAAAAVAAVAVLGLACAGDPAGAAALARRHVGQQGGDAASVEVSAVYAGLVAALVGSAAPLDAKELVSLSARPLTPGAPVSSPAAAIVAGVCSALEELRLSNGPDVLRLAAWLQRLAPAGSQPADAAAAAVTGAILGARDGAGGMREWSLAMQATRDSGPGDYWPDDLPVLADGLLSLPRPA